MDLRLPIKHARLGQKYRPLMTQLSLLVQRVKSPF
jgi:hypothetical protein